MVMSLTRTVGFRALHRFHRPEWSPERNRAAFGPLGDPPGYPHDYRCAVTVTGPMDPATNRARPSRATYSSTVVLAMVAPARAIS